MKRNTSKVILNKFMMRKNLINVNIVTKDLMKKNTTKVILNQFMRGRNLMNVNIATKYLMKNKTSSHIESVHEGKKPYECDICGKVFPKMYPIKQHVCP